MSQLAHQLPITAAEYLEGERYSEKRHEFIDGRVYARFGASRRHNSIVGDAYSLFKNHLKGGPCNTYIEAIKVRLADAIGECYYYPDVVVTGEEDDDDSNLVTMPRLLVEVISPSTSRIDRGDKLTNYKRIPTVEEIVLIEQDWPEVVVYRREERWKRNLFTKLETIVDLRSIELSLPVKSFYDSVNVNDAPRPWYHLNLVE